MKLKDLRKKVEESKLKTSAKWWKGRKEFALYLIDYLCSPDLEVSSDTIEKILLNGADNWQAYSEGGLPYCYDEDIATALYPPSEVKRMLKSNSYDWIEIQGRALHQAFLLCKRYCK